MTSDLDDVATLEQSDRQVRARLARVENERDDLMAVLLEVLVISDRKHEVWNRAQTLLHTCGN